MEPEAPLASSRDIICAECRYIYTESEITTTDEAGRTQTLTDVLGARTTPSADLAPKATKTARRLFGGRDQAVPEARKPSDPPPDSFIDKQRSNLSNLTRLEDRVFKCPKDHVVDGNRGLQIPIAVIGTSGASKSHFLPGLIWETGNEKKLRRAGVSVREAQYTATGLKAALTAVYIQKQVLPPTPPTSVLGPFGYRLTVAATAREDRYSMLLFDVGGEALSSIARILEQAPFVLLSRAIFLLIDPDGLLPTEFDEPDAAPRSPRESLIAATKVRDGIIQIVDALEEMWELPMKDIPVPVCFVVAKADSVRWSFPWETETDAVLEDGSNSGLRSRLIQSSSRVREELISAGGSSVVDDIDESFSSDRIRFVAASATSEMPSEPVDDHDLGSWSDPTPNGIALALLHVLDLIGLVEQSDDPR